MDNIVSLYSRSNFALFPLNGKVPTVPAWQDTPVDLNASFTGNYGVVIGPSRLVVDIDVRDGRKGIESFRSLVKDLNLPTGWEKETFIVKTGSGGYHIYLSVPKGTYRKTLSLYPNIEFLSGNAYVVGAGSKHPDTGLSYVVVSRSPNDLSPAPAALIEALKLPDPVPGAATMDVEDNDPLNIARFVDIINNTPAADQGNRSRALYMTACKGRDIGLSEAVCLETLEKNFKMSVPFDDPGEFAKTVKNAYNYAKNPQGVRSISAIFKQEEEIEKIDPTSLVWDKTTKYNKKGEVVGETIHKTLNNCVNHMLTLCPTFRFNTFTSKTEVTSQIPWIKTRGNHMPEVWDDDYTFAQYYLAKTAHIEYMKGQVVDAITICGRKRQYNPVHNYLNSLVWDGKPRIDSWLIDYAGVVDNEYTRAVCRKVICGAIRRVMEPGCKFDYVLVLEGRQGIGKSTLIRTLGKLWFAELKFDPSKDMVHKMQGKWIIELTEMAGLRHAEMNAIKAFITIQKDTVRLSYAREPKDIPRQSIFIGTINPNGGYLSDIENRRFWMVECKEIDIIGFESVVDQLWAEGMMCYKDEPLYLQGKANEIQIVESVARRPEEALLPAINRWLEANPTVDETTTSQIAEWAGLRGANMSELCRIASVLESNGWTRRNSVKGTTNQATYCRPFREIALRQMEGM